MAQPDLQGTLPSLRISPMSRVVDSSNFESRGAGVSRRSTAPPDPGAKSTSQAWRSRVKPGIPNSVRTIPFVEAAVDVAYSDSVGPRLRTFVNDREGIDESFTPPGNAKNVDGR